MSGRRCGDLGERCKRSQRLQLDLECGNHAEAQGGLALSGSVTGLAAGATFAITVAVRALVRIVERSHPDCRKTGAPLFSFQPCHRKPGSALQRVRRSGRATVSPARENADPTPTWTGPPKVPASASTRDLRPFADLDPPQTFALKSDEILGNERQMVWKSGRALQARPTRTTRSPACAVPFVMQSCRGWASRPAQSWS
jgi:hypothetical protein